jgi:dihydroorotate dehydrogenase
MVALVDRVRMIYEHLLRPILFRLGRGDAEAAHDATLRLLALMSRTRLTTQLLRTVWGQPPADLSRTLFGLRFPTPLGLAAGMDKNGVALPAWEALGFGFVEVGTVTWHAQPGNPRPRLFRLTADQALINRMGFNNAGAAALAQRLAQVGPQLSIPVGVSIGKSKIAPLEEAEADYSAALAAIFRHAAYVAINISSPNTPGLRELQDRAALDRLLAALQQANQRLATEQQSQLRPLLVKFAPDLSETAVGEALAVCTRHRVAGVIAVNTTLQRTGLSAASMALAGETGGLSGKPLSERAAAMVRLIARETSGRLPIIGVGGISSPADAIRMLDAGASLLQIYTGLVYTGPALVTQINRALRR